MEQRISKIIARSGFCSRRTAEDLITAGRVKLNGNLVLQPYTLCTEEDEIAIDDKIISTKKQETKLWAFHKPKGVITTHKDERNRETLFSLLPAWMKSTHIISVGRLDFNSEGLILLTNDGELARFLELPANKVVRGYRVKLFGSLSNLRKLEDLVKGVVIEGIKYQAHEVVLKLPAEKKKVINFWMEIKLQEGKNREIRKMVEHWGYKVQKLIRTSYGPFELDDLPLCGIKELDIEKIIRS